MFLNPIKTAFSLIFTLLILGVLGYSHYKAFEFGYQSRQTIDNNAIASFVFNHLTQENP